jgi:hypothetical protein
MILTVPQILFVDRNNPSAYIFSAISLQKYWSFALFFWSFWLYQLPTTSHAQQIPVGIKGFAEYVDIGMIDSLSKEIFFERGMAWLKANDFKVKSSNVVKDLHEWKIIVKGKTETYLAFVKDKEMKIGKFSYILSIHVKDGKYKCIINGIQYDSNYIPDLIGKDISEKQPFEDEKYVEDGFLAVWVFMQENVHKDMQTLLSSLKIQMLGLKR